MRLISGTISSPLLTARDPPGMKQFCTSTTMSASRVPGLSANPARAPRVATPIATLANRNPRLVKLFTSQLPDRRRDIAGFRPTIASARFSVKGGLPPPRTTARGQAPTPVRLELGQDDASFVTR